MKLHNLGGVPFLTLSPEDRLSFIGRYREKRFSDFTAIIEFDLSCVAAKAKKKRSSSSTNPKEKSNIEKKLKVNSEQLDMLKKLGLL